MRTTRWLSCETLAIIIVVVGVLWGVPQKLHRIAPSDL